MRGSVASQVGYIWGQIDGIGLSKAESREDSHVKSLDDSRAISDKVHSYEYKDEVIRTAIDFGSFAREEFGIKDYEKIDGDVLQTWVDHKLENDVTEGTLSNYISHLGKVVIALERIVKNSGRDYIAFTRADLNEAREFIQKHATSTEYVNRAYKDAGAIISNLERGEYAAGRLQLEYGLRVSEATYIKEYQLFENFLTYEGKGGKEQTKELSSALVMLIKTQMRNGLFKVDQNHYRESIRESARIEGDKYSGSHGLRYNYAQREYVERFDTKIKSGMAIDRADKTSLHEVSVEMGHNREAITCHYLGR